MVVAQQLMMWHDNVILFDTRQRTLNLIRDKFITYMGHIFDLTLTTTTTTAPVTQHIANDETDYVLSGPSVHLSCGGYIYHD